MQILRIFKSKFGYTLVELILVLALLALILSIALPSFGVLCNFKEKNELKTFKRDIMHIRTAAVIENCIYYLTLDSNKNGYIITKVDKVRKNIKTVDFKDGIKLDDFQDLTIGFLPSGAPDNPTTISLTNKRNDKINIAISVGTGRVNLTINGK